MISYEPKHLPRWYEFANYEGTNYSDYYVGAQRFFRCTPFERATFQYMRETLHEDGSPLVIDVTFTDECLVARYQVLIHKSYVEGLRLADMMFSRLIRKGYVDPEVQDDEEDDIDPRTLPEPPFNAAKPTGRYVAIQLKSGTSGGSTTTLCVQRKSVAKEREKAALERNARALKDAGGVVQLVARPYDGIKRRYGAARYHDSYDYSPDPIEA